MAKRANKHLIEKWRAGKYNGVKGTLDEWVPDHHRQHFMEIQDNLYQKVVVGELLYEEIIQKVIWYSKQYPIARFFAGPNRDTDYFFLGDLLRANIEEEKAPSKGVGLKRLLGPNIAEYVRLGVANRKSIALADKLRNGTAEAKAKRYREYQEEIDRSHRLNSRLSRHASCSLAAKKFGVNARTIKRHTEDPKN